MFKQNSALIETPGKHDRNCSQQQIKIWRCEMNMEIKESETFSPGPRANRLSNCLASFEGGENRDLYSDQTYS